MLHPLTISVRTRSRRVAVRLSILLMLVVAGGAAASPTAAAGPVVTGTISTLDGKIRLPGVVVTLIAGDGRSVGETVTDESGRYRLEAPAPGLYKLTTTIEGFHAAEQPVPLAAGATRTVDIDLRLVEIEQTVNVTPATDTPMSLSKPLAPVESIDGLALSTSAMSGGSVAAELRWLPGVSAYGRDWAIKGGRPNQIGLQVETAQVLDPAAGTSPVELPGDAINAVQVMANPYAVEFGRFSSGVIVVSTRSGANKWKATVNNFLPGFIVKRGSNPFNIIGIKTLDPRVSVGGPIIKNRLFLAESVQFRYRSDEVASRPQSQRQITRNISSFTRLDYVVSARNTVTGTFTLAPENADWVNLNTFNSPDATANLTQRVYRAGVSDTVQLPHSMVLEALAHFTSYDTTVDGHGAATALFLSPPQNVGTYYSTQSRKSHAWQASVTVSGFVKGLFGQHLIKGGVDVMQASLDGAVQSRPINVLRQDGTLTRQLLAAPAVVHADANDIAAFVQDRLHVSDRVVLEYGLRVERDGVFGHVAAIPRVGAVVALDRARNATIRGGWGYFYERVPLMAGAFSQLAGSSETAYGVDGTTPLGPPVVYSHTLAESLATPRSVTWNIGYEHRIRSWLSVRANHLERDGRRELMLDTGQTGSSGWIQLSSRGQSTYRDTEVGAHLKHATLLDVDVTYTHASSVADLNDAYGYYLTLTANPILRMNAVGPTDTDTPHRFVGRGRANLGRTWVVEIKGEIRSGFPYSAVDEQLEFVGARNSLRFPTRRVMDASIEHRVRIGRFKPWLGLVFINALNSFIPGDVQRNVASPSFGRFYSSPLRQIRITAHF
jgi:hypothetical protein